MTETVIKRTQEVLGKYVTKPPLTEKLLGKPPFRYLHDIINVVVNEHGFLKGLYSDQELSSDNIKDRDAKIAFLQKCIDATSLAVGESLNVRPSKIVAGHEVENTNFFLQALAKGIEEKLDTKDVVKKVLSNPKSVKREKSSKEAKKDDTKSSPKQKPSHVSSNDTKTNGERRPVEKDRKLPSTNDSQDKTTSKTKSSKDTTEGKRSISKDKVSSRDKKDGTKPKSKESTRPTKDRSSRERADKERKDEKNNKEKGEEKSKVKTRTTDKSKSKTRESSTTRTGKENSPPKVSSKSSSKMVNGISKPTEVSQSNKSKSKINKSEPISVEDDGPPSLLTIEGASNGGPTIIYNEDLEAKAGSLEENIEQLTMNGHADSNILGRNGELMGAGPFNHMGKPEPSDSGVGSLESPKNSAKNESLPNNADAKGSSKSIPGTPGPRPPTMQSYHPDLDEKVLEQPKMNSSQEENTDTERPRTGMGIRPRTGRRSARPPSARPAPPRVRENREVLEEEAPRPLTGRPLANVILDGNTKDEINSQNRDDDDEEYVVGKPTPIIKEDEPTIENMSDPSLEKDKKELLEGERDAKGILVAQILETKKELEDNRKEAFSPETPGHRRVPLDQTFQGDLSRRKEKELIQKDVEKLTSSIQALTRSVNPLAKMLDYLQEDFDSMKKELESWRKENERLTQNLKAEESLTDQQLEPLKAQLEEADAAIWDHHDRISAIKSIILRNEEKIKRLLGGINAK